MNKRSLIYSAFALYYVAAGNSTMPRSVQFIDFWPTSEVYIEAFEDGILSLEATTGKALTSNTKTQCVGHVYRAYVRGPATRKTA